MRGFFLLSAKRDSLRPVSGPQCRRLTGKVSKHDDLEGRSVPNGFLMAVVAFSRRFLRSVSANLFHTTRSSAPVTRGRSQPASRLTRNGPTTGDPTDLSRAMSKRAPTRKRGVLSQCSRGLFRRRLALREHPFRPDEVADVAVQSWCSRSASQTGPTGSTTVTTFQARCRTLQQRWFR